MLCVILPFPQKSDNIPHSFFFFYQSNNNRQEIALTVAELAPEIEMFCKLFILVLFLSTFNVEADLQTIALQCQDVNYIPVYINCLVSGQVGE